MTATWDPWNYRETASLGTETTNLVGYKVHATDGDIGKVDEASDVMDARHIVVDTGPWIFGRKVVLPAGVVERVDHADESIYVDLTKEQIKDSPEVDENTGYDDPVYRDRVGSYYGNMYR